MQAHLVRIAAAPESGCVALDQKQAEPVTRFWHCARHDDEQIADLAVGDVGLRSIQHPLIALLFSACTDARQVAVRALLLGDIAYYQASRP